MLRAYIIDFGGSWDSHLPLAEFSYNNSYHASIGGAPFEMLYGRKCRTPVCWGEVGQRVLGSTEVVLKTTKLIQKVRERLLTAQSRQKSYADRRRSDLEFQVGDYVLLKSRLVSAEALRFQGFEGFWRLEEGDPMCVDELSRDIREYLHGYESGISNDKGKGKA
ncbi:hypothetical protein L2E82_50197 [Cichorium intybus]|nr:hypothetical protein L2E82_50197 [Cichorium intybus]